MATRLENDFITAQPARTVRAGSHNSRFQTKTQDEFISQLIKT